MKIRRYRTVCKSYVLGTVVLAYHEAIRENDNPNIRFEIDYKQGGYYYLVKCDYREIPDFDPRDLLPQVECPHWQDRSQAAQDARDEYHRRQIENQKRISAHVKNNVGRALKGKLGS